MYIIYTCMTDGSPKEDAYRLAIQAVKMYHNLSLSMHLYLSIYLYIYL